MRASEEGSLGAQGRSEVRGKFESFGWGPDAVSGEHDLGTDLLVQVRDERRFDLGLLVGVQVKTGPSYFQEAEINDQGGADGWWYRENDGKHFTYWIRHAVPHLLVLHDPDRNESFWVHVIAEKVESTGKGNKIFVPASQRIEAGQLGALIDVAKTQRTGISVEGTAWSAGASSVSPGQRYRYALLAPRLIAPHPNRAVDRALFPPEAIALLVRGRVSELNRYVEKYEATPKPDEAIESGDWGWRFFGSIWRWVVEGDGSLIEERIADAVDATQRTAAAVTCACSEFDSEKFLDAIARLTVLIDQDDAAPLDWAWMLVHRGRLRREVGDWESAREDLLAASKAVVRDADDICSSILTAAAVSLLWSTMGWSERNVEELIRANDTVVAWWRSQTISTALQEASDRSFLAWVEDRSIRFGADDTLLNGLFSAGLGAHLGGEHDSWRANSSLLARHELMGSRQANEVRDALDLLRRCGDSSGLEKASDRVWRLGPLEALQESTAVIGPQSWTYTTASANFKAWKVGGDLLSEPAGSDAALFCLQVLKDDPPAELLAARPAFLLHHAAAEALAALLPPASPEVSRETIKYVSALTDPVDDLLATDLCTVVERVHNDAFSGEFVERLRRVGVQLSQKHLGAIILSRLTGVGDEASREELIKRAGEGDLYSLAELRDPQSLGEQGARAVIDVFVSGVLALQDEAHKNHWGMGVFDLLDGLARSNLIFPRLANWELVTEVLADPKVLINQKVACCRFLAGVASELPTNAVEGLRAVFDAIASTPDRGFPFPGEEGSFGGTLDHLAIALGMVDGAALAKRLAGLALQSSSERRDLARALTSSGSPEMIGALAALAGDVNTEVWTAAGTSAARRIAGGIATDVEHEIARVLGGRDGILGPQCILAGLSYRREDLGDQAMKLVHSLLGHPSARVRLWSRRVAGLQGQGDPET